MKHYLYISSMILLSCLAFAGCQLQDDLFGKKTEKQELGILELDVVAYSPASMSTKADENANAVDTKDFSVLIKGEEQTDGTAFERTYNKVAEMPAAITLPVGNYTVSSNTPGEMQKRMTKPYYAGNTALSITKGITSNSNVKCTMQNSRIQVKYSDEFKSNFTSWTVTMDDGTETALSFDQDEDMSTPIYWAFGENVSQIRVNIRAVTKEGNTVTDSRTFVKSMVTEGYGDVNSDSFAGGDALELDFKPSTSESATGQVKGINVSVYITFSEYKEQVMIPVSDKEEEQTPSTPNTPTTPTVGNPSIVLPNDFTYSLSGNPAKPASADATLKMPAGLKSALVKIETNNQAFTTTLQDAAFDTPGALLTGAELIGNVAMQNLFNTMGLKESNGSNKQTPKAGVTEYTFPIGAFFTFLDIFTGTHKFHLTLTDANNKQVTATLTVTITK